MNDSLIFDWEVKETDQDEKHQDGDVLFLKHTQKLTKKEHRTYLSRQRVEQIITEIPRPGEATHIVSNGYFDYYDIIPAFCKLIKKPLELFATTWTVRYESVTNMMELFDNGAIKSIHMVVGEYLKSREPAVYNLLFESCNNRGQVCKARKNHTKITLLGNHDEELFIVIEGSANFTANPRVEQYIINNDKELYEFHKKWIINS